ncbi:hypothetical protein AF332_11805 [Sporosarcina globispora]|uniref:Uncharacterized protein n=1 Tax=Sporosarcina globispora TaxID=1459 RepID=A0A0M0GC92_SPOGL|nr:hypothetical protein [Sporosarcina globispora]KON87444.1 hypothetical protein AF332_11805 [Sporosarcina globispora]
MKAKFNCYYERDEKGIYMEVDTESYTNLVGFTFCVDFKAEGEVCLEEKEIESLIEILQAKLKK